MLEFLFVMTMISEERLREAYHVLRVKMGHSWRSYQPRSHFVITPRKYQYTPREREFIMFRIVPETGIAPELIQAVVTAMYTSSIRVEIAEVKREIFVYGSISWDAYERIFRSRLSLDRDGRLQEARTKYGNRIASVPEELKPFVRSVAAIERSYSQPLAYPLFN